MLINNQVKYGLSSSVFTKNVQNVFNWINTHGSDCGLVNVNTATTGSEVGGAYGGEKQSGLGRETGSDSWKQYMRRVTSVVNYGSNLPISTNINFNPAE